VITIESVFSKKNQAKAFEYLENKKNGGGTDYVPLSDFKEYWELNRENIISEIKSGEYAPGLIQEYEIVNGKGKRRIVTKFNQLDKFITRLLSQKLNEFYDKKLSRNCCAYLDGRGTLFAAELAKAFVENGNEFVVEIDVRHFFDEICIEKLIKILNVETKDIKVLKLIEKYCRCFVTKGAEVIRKEKGILQGSSMSPVLSNIYLDGLDKYLDKAGYNWLRYADNICVYTDSMEAGVKIYEEIIELLKTQFDLEYHPDKSGVYDVFERRLLGYDFRKKGKRILVERHTYKDNQHYRAWHPCAIQRINKEYHLIQNGTLNKKDYALLFENEDEKHHIPVEATEQLDIYNEVIITSSVLRTLGNENVRLGVFDKYGDLVGYFIPEGYSADSKMVLAQCNEYNDKEQRLITAKAMEKAAIHNLRANIRYYNKKENVELNDIVQALSNAIIEMEKAISIEQLLLIEARCRQQYYQTFNTIINRQGFEFGRRTKRPPEDPINALISFGNTLLYNRVQQIIWRTALDSRIGVFHAANKRHCSLNLDFADIYKPIIVDRVIFTLINRGQLSAESFMKVAENGVYLSEDGKRCFIEAFEKKMYDKVTINRKSFTYMQIIENDVRAYIKHLQNGNSFKPYKYY